MSISISVTIFITGPVFTWYGDRYQKFCTLLINSEAVGQTGGSGCLLIAQLELPPIGSWRRCDLVKCQRRQTASLPHVHPVPLTNVSAPLSHLPPHTPTHPRMSSPFNEARGCQKPQTRHRSRGGAQAGCFPQASPPVSQTRNYNNN